MKTHYLPPSLWSSDMLTLPSKLCGAHKDFLIEKNWWSEYDPSKPGIVGGNSQAEAKDHVVNRFLNSAARMQYVCSDPRKEQPEVRSVVLDQLAHGRIFLLDLAAGNGAGTIAMLALICELRQHENIPKLPLNVTIRGVDYSAEALNFYAELLGKITPWLSSQGIEVLLNLSLCDLTVSGDLDEILDEFFDAAKASGINRFLCTVSALSGAKKTGLESMLDALKLAAARLSHRSRNSSWLWVEPAVDKSWFGKLVETVRLTMQRVRHQFFTKTTDQKATSSTDPSPDPIARVFNWKDPHNSHITKSHVAVIHFKNSSS
jgi:hypothetical protein